MPKFALNRIDVKQESYNQALPIWGEQTVGQTFFSQNNHLSIVKVFTFRSPYGVEGKTKAKNLEQIVFHLREENNNQNLRTINFSGSNVFDGDWLRLQFPPIVNSSNKKYYFFLESSNSTKDNAINLATSNVDTYQAGNAIAAGKVFTGDLRFQTFYSQPAPLVARNIVGDFGKKLSSDLGFTLVWAILILAVIVIFLAKLIKK